MSENRYFLIIKKKKVLFTVVNSINEAILMKEKFTEDYSIDNIYFLLESFLKKNIFEIEKDLKNFIKKIYIIFESDSFFVAKSSIKHNIKLINFNHSQLNDTLIEIRNQFNKHSPGYKTIHMVIDRYIVNGSVQKTLPENIDSENLVIQVNFICLEDKIIDNFKKIFSKYQISISKIFSYEYLKNLNNYSSENIAKIANDNLNGLNANEVFITKKISKNLGFFEKFFNIFN
jgi:cell division ATPase FtsA